MLETPLQLSNGPLGVPIVTLRRKCLDGLKLIAKVMSELGRRLDFLCHVTVARELPVKLLAKSLLLGCRNLTLPASGHDREKKDVGTDADARHPELIELEKRITREKARSDKER